MHRAFVNIASLCLLAVLCGVGCTDAEKTNPSFVLAWSEYPSWSVFGVAEEKGLVDGKEGELGPIEKKWNVDIVLKEVDYDTCITMYNTSACDAVCITNMDILNPALGRKSVAVLPTSTSVGADACVVTGISDVKELRSHKVYGLSKSVSEYCFVRNLEKAGEKEADHQFTNMDPGAAAQAMQTKQDGYNAIMVWNPFVLQSLKMRPDAKVLFDSSTIPGEIVDMVCIAQASLDKPNGQAFAHAVVDAFYEVNKLLAAPATADETLVALGAKFSSLGLEEMKTVVKQTAFYKTPEEALALFTGEELKATMKTVTDFCQSHEIIESAPSIGYGSAAQAAEAQLRIDPSFVQAVRDAK